MQYIVPEYIPDELVDVEVFRGRKYLHKHCAETAGLAKGDFAEFGVYKGVSARWILNLMPDDRKLWLFDSFEGLPEDWNHGRQPWNSSFERMHPKGVFATEVPSFTDERAVIVKGMFEDTLPQWSRGGPRLAYIHIDSDLYSSAATVLEHTTKLMWPGTVVNFDDLWGYERYEEGEWKALQEWKVKYDLDYEWIGRTESKCQAALRIR